MGRRFSRRTTRFGGKAPFVPTQIAGNVLWLRSDLGITLNGATVSQWNDQSGTGDANKNQVQAGAPQQPTFNATDASYNDKPSLSFDQVDDHMLGAGDWASVVPAVATWFVVGDFSGTGSCWFFQNSAGTYQMWKAENAANDDTNFFQGATLTVTFAGAANVKHVWCVEANGASSKIYRDSLTAAGTGNSGAGTAANLGVVGAGGRLGGKVVEFIGYAGVLSAPDRTLVMGYLASRYAVALT